MTKGSFRLSDIFVTLTSGKIFIIFVIFFAVGSFVIWINYYPLYIASAIVILYSLFLFFVQNKYYISFSEETKNSPYFLGFLFTLVCLFRIFFDFPLHAEELSPRIFTFLVPQIGTALSTTILGLIARQLIVSFDPTQEQQEKIFRLATDELKENVAVYKIAQQRLLDLINEFVDSHIELMEQEKKVSKEHTSLLLESVSALQKLGQQYPPKVLGILDSFDNIQGKFDKFVKEDLADSFKDASEKFREIQFKMSKEAADQLHEFYNSYLVILKGSLQTINEDLGKLKENLSAFASSFQSCNAILDDGFKNNLNQIDNHLSKLSTVILSTNKIIQENHKSTFNSFKALQVNSKMLFTQINRFNEEYLDKLKLFKNELIEIDKLISTFIEVTKKRLEL